MFLTQPTRKRKSALKYIAFSRRLQKHLTLLRVRTIDIHSMSRTNHEATNRPIHGLVENVANAKSNCVTRFNQLHWKAVGVEQLCLSDFCKLVAVSILIT